MIFNIYYIAALVAMCALTAGLIVFSLLYHPDRVRVKKMVKELYAERDRGALFAKTMKERQGKQRNRKFLKVSKKFESEIESADLPVSASEFLVLWVAAVALPVLLAFALTGRTIVAVGAGSAGLLIPVAVFKKKQAERMEQFGAQLGDALLTICNGLRSGFSFQQSIRAITKDMTPPISIEFAKALAEMDYGTSQHDALLHMYDRVRNEDLKMLISALEIAQRTGGNLSDVLQTISDTVKTRIKIRQEVRALSAQGKMSALIIGGLPIILLIFLAIRNPDYIGQLLYSSTGQKLLILAAVMEIIGFTMMNKITDVKL